MTPRAVPEIAEGLRSLSQAFAAVRDPRLSVLEGLAVPRRLDGALLATVLGQDLRIGSLTRLLRALDERLGEGLLVQQVADWKALERACRFAWLAEWPHREALAGWVLATSDFLRAHGSLSSWKDHPGGPRDLVQTMARELPWMGSRSPSKVKGWRLLRWLARGELGNFAWEVAARAEIALPVAAVERPLRTLGWLPGGWAEWTAATRQEWFDGQLAASGIGEPTAAWVPLEMVLARGRQGPACQEHLGGCARCPVRCLCPSPGRT